MRVCEHHLHLYGCLTAADVWQLGRDRWRGRQKQLDHYASNYAKFYGITPDYKKFWQQENGLELIKKYYEVDTHLTFLQFQAKFNLLIALFPVQDNDFFIWEHILHKHMLAGMHYAEYRFVYPPPPLAPAPYLRRVNTIISHYIDMSAGNFNPRLALSLAREPAQALTQYRTIRKLLATDPAAFQYISGIDLCGFEEDYPPCLYRHLFQEINADNQRSKHQLAILIHIGESFTQLSLHSSIRRVLQAYTCGAHRLGHAISLGIDPENLRGKEVWEDKNEHLIHLRWLLQEKENLKAHAYEIDTTVVQNKIKKLTENGENKIKFVYNNETLPDLCLFQDTALRLAKKNKLLIESCPTSNYFLGKIKKYRYHPLVKFKEHDLQVLLSSDDPGIFNTDWQQEKKFCQQKLNIEPDFFAALPC